MLKSLALSFALVTAATGAHAAAVVGGSTLLTAGYANQLETWLGEGAITLTNLYTKQAGDTSTTFHNKVDNQGRTFVVMFAKEGNGNSAIIGGYNKDSWSSTGTTNDDLALGDGKDNFLFNLSTSTKKSQTEKSSTSNRLDYGPTFGRGHDIYVDADLSGGYSSGLSYGDQPGTSLVDGSKWDAFDVSYSAIEVFTISAGTPSIPEPMSLALVGVALAAGAAASRRRT